MRHKSGSFNKANPMPVKACGARKRAEASDSSGRTKARGRGGEGQGRWYWWAQDSPWLLMARGGICGLRFEDYGNRCASRITEAVALRGLRKPLLIA
jgi:hypothetical protein